MLQFVGMNMFRPNEGLLRVDVVRVKVDDIDALETNHAIYIGRYPNYVTLFCRKNFRNTRFCIETLIR